MMRGITTAIATRRACSRAAAPRSRPRRRSLVPFTPYSQQAFDAALGKGGPVVVLGTAPSWCHYCVLLQRGALSDPGVKAALEPFTSS